MYKLWPSCRGLEDHLTKTRTFTGSSQGLCLWWWGFLPDIRGGVIPLRL